MVVVVVVVVIITATAKDSLGYRMNTFTAMARLTQDTVRLRAKY